MAGLKKLDFVKCSTRACDKACLILKHTHESSQALYAAYEIARAVRSIKKQKESKSEEKKEFATLRGMSTDEEQDLLRSMLVSAASGLDAMTKQLIRDALPKILEIDKEALTELEKFVSRKLRDEIDDIGISERISFLARVLTAPSTQSQIIEDYINYLTKGSLQSSDELSRVTKAFGISQKEVSIDQTKLRPIFESRNRIIHELDINFNVKRRRRNLRSESIMKSYSETLIELAENIIKSVDTKLSKAKFHD
jgi:hypothetical protein